MHSIKRVKLLLGFRFNKGRQLNHCNLLTITLLVYDSGYFIVYFYGGHSNNKKTISFHILVVIVNEVSPSFIFQFEYG